MIGLGNVYDDYRKAAKLSEDSLSTEELIGSEKFHDDHKIVTE